MAETTAARMLEMLALLQVRREWAGRGLADRLEVGERTVRRDVERLRALGYPVESTRGRAGGYRLRAGGALPPLLLDDDEATAIAVALRTAAGASVAGVEENALRALVKLEQVLPNHLRRRVAAIEQATATVALGATTEVEPETLMTLAVACRDGEALRFRYRDRHEASTEREVEPRAIVHAGRRWYLVAWDRGRDDWRTFRVDRVGRPRAGGARCMPRELPGGDPAAFVRERLAPAHRFEAVATVQAPAASVRSLRWLGGTVEEIDSGRCLVRTGDADLEWLGLRLASLPFEFELHEPPELRERLRHLGRRLARATAGGPGAGSPPAASQHPTA